MGFSDIKIGKEAPEQLNVIIEIPKGSHNKYEYDEEDHEIHLDRVYHSAVFSPTDYGFIPETRSEDGDHLDILVLMSEPTFPGCVMKVRPIGILDMEDESGIDWKVIAVAVKDPHSNDIKDIKDVEGHLIKEIKNFFEIYKTLEEGKWVKVKDWHGKDEALKRIEEARERFNKESSGK
ncbi:inorganic diphosphatase [Patescibacteria group bacterium]